MTIHCELCGEELTAPQFFEGKPYGWSCIKKVNPAAKKTPLISFTEFMLQRPVIGRPERLRCKVIYGKFLISVTGIIHDEHLWVTKSQLDKVKK